MGEDSRDQRSRGFTIGAAIIFLLLIFRLVQLQVVQGEAYEALAAGNRIRLIPIEAPRGQVLDRNGEVIATNRPAYSVYLMYMGVRELDQSIDELARVLGMKQEEIREKVREKQGRLFEPIKLKSDVSNEQHTAIEELRPKLPGVVVGSEPVRYYPKGSLAAHVLGYMGEISKEELKVLKDKGYVGGDVIGKTGVEKTYDELLRGRDGGRQVEVDALGRPVKILGTIEPIRGNDIELTIDSRLQQVAEGALRKAIERRRNDPVKPSKALGGAVVAMDPNTGEILAMASEPSFDPNSFAVGMKLQEWQALANNPLQPLTNRAIMGEYPPGSAFKMITAIAALEGGHVNTQEIFDTNGGVYWIIPKKCWAYSIGGHGRINLYQAIAYSCNIVFYELGRRVGIDDIEKYAREFGLGERTGILDLPGERVGNVASKAYKRLKFPDDPTFWLGELLDAAIGQGFHQYTPLQMANYVSMIANGGIHYRPFLVKKVISPDGKVLKEVKPEVLGTAKVSKDTFEIVRRGMLGVTSPGGTAAAAFSGFPIPVAGKTGTAEVESDPSSSRDPHGWFVGFAPADRPQIALAVFIENGGGGAVAAAPVAREVLDAFFALAPAEEIP